MNWHKAVNDASTQESLLAVVIEYVLAYPEAYWSWIPREARPRLVATVEELQERHQRLSTLLASTESPNIRLQDLAVFFLQASARAIELAGAKGCCNDDGEDARSA